MATIPTNMKRSRRSGLLFLRSQVPYETYFMRKVSANATTDIRMVMAAAMTPTSANFFTGVTSPLLLGTPGGSAQLFISSHAATGTTTSVAVYPDEVPAGD